MTCIAHGIDLVSVRRFGLMLDRHGRRFTDRCFTPAESEYCERQARRRAEHYAARFAAKEAVLKALGTGWRDGIAWTDIEVRRAPSGAPGVALGGEAHRRAQLMGVRQWLISLTHTSETASASVIALA